MHKFQEYKKSFKTTNIEHCMFIISEEKPGRKNKTKESLKQKKRCRFALFSRIVLDIFNFNSIVSESGKNIY